MMIRLYILMSALILSRQDCEHTSNITDGTFLIRHTGVLAPVLLKIICGHVLTSDPSALPRPTPLHK